MTDTVRSAPIDIGQLPVRGATTSSTKATPRQNQKAGTAERASPRDSADAKPSAPARKQSEKTDIAPAEQVRSSAGKTDNKDDHSSNSEPSDAFATIVDDATRGAASEPAAASQVQTTPLTAFLAGVTAAQPQMQAETQPGIDATSVFARQRRTNIALNIVKLDQADAESTQVPLDAVSADGEIKAVVSVQSRETHWFMGEKSPSTANVASLPAASLATQSQVLGTSKTLISKSASESQPPATNNLASESTPQTSAIQPTRQGDASGQGEFARSESGTPGSHSSPAAEAAKAVSKAAGVETDTMPSAAGPAPVIQQVKQSVLDALSRESNAAPTPASPALPADKPAVPGAVLRSIEVTLAPADLGSVKLKLSLKDNALSIDAETSKATTAALLKSDRAVLEQNLREAGYDVAAVRISDVSAGSSSAFNGNASTGGSAYSRSGDWQQQAQAGGGDGQRRGGSGSEQQRRFGQTQEQPATLSGERAQPKGVYI